MESTTRTIYGSALQTAQLLGLPYEIQDNTTLNQRFGILENAVISEGVFPRVGYYCIGNGGHESVTGADGIPLAREVPHRATDASLYRPLAFIRRPTDETIPDYVTELYALWRVEEYNGLTYNTAYAKRINLSGVQVELEHRVVDENDNIESSYTFYPSSENLVPTPPYVRNSGANVLIADYITCSARLSLSLTAQEVLEICNACMIANGDISYAIISEIGICSGVDKAISSAGAYINEVIGAQIVSHINTMHVLRYTPSGLDAIFDIGTNEPLLSMSL